MYVERGLTRNSHDHPLLRTSVLLSKVPQAQQLDARASKMKGLELSQVGQLRGKGIKGQHCKMQDTAGQIGPLTLDAEACLIFGL